MGKGYFCFVGRMIKEIKKFRLVLRFRFLVLLFVLFLKIFVLYIVLIYFDVRWFKLEGREGEGEWCK